MFVVAQTLMTLESPRLEEQSACCTSRGSEILDCRVAGNFATLNSLVVRCSLPGAVECRPQSAQMAYDTVSGLFSSVNAQRQAGPVNREHEKDMARSSCWRG